MMTTTAYRHVVQDDSIRSGKPIVVGSRLGVHDVVGLLQNGESVGSLLLRVFPQLTRAQVYECLAYYEDQQGEMDLLISAQMELPSP